MEKYALNHSNSFFYVGCNFKPYDLCKVSSQELCNYIKKHKSIVAWKLELYNIFKEGERRYGEAIFKNFVSDNTKTAHLVRKLKKDNWKYFGNNI